MGPATLYCGYCGERAQVDRDTLLKHGYRCGCGKLRIRAHGDIGKEQGKKIMHRWEHDRHRQAKKRRAK